MTISEGMQTGIVVVIAVNLYDRKVLLVSMLVNKWAILRNNYVDGNRLSNSVVCHSADEVSAS